MSSSHSCFALLGLLVCLHSTYNVVQAQHSRAFIADYNYFASIESYGKHVCSATIVDDLYVLTTNSCVRQYDIKSLSVRAGTDRQGYRGKVYKVTEVQASPSVDLAMVKVGAFMTFDPKVMPLKPSNQDLTQNQTAVLVAWKDKASESFLTTVPITVLPKSNCSALYEGVMNLTSSMYCVIASQPTSNTCIVDEGVPLYYNEQQAGIVSYSPDCTSGLPLVVMDISDYTSFIIQTLVDYEWGF